MVAERHRLRRLQMGHAGDRVGRVLVGAVGQRPHQVAQLRQRAVDGVAHPEPEIGGDLVVAAARGVQPAAGVADARDQARLDVHMDVLQRRIEVEPPLFDVGADRRQSVANAALVIGGEDAHLRQHGGVGERALDVLPPEFLVEGDRYVDRLHHRRRPAREAATPLLVGVLGVWGQIGQ